MMITAVYFQARPGVVFSTLPCLHSTSPNRPGCGVLCNILGPRLALPPCRGGPNLTGQNKNSGSAGRLVRWGVWSRGNSEGWARAPGLVIDIPWYTE